MLPKIAANEGHAFSKESCRTVSSDNTTGSNRNGWPTVERMVAVDFVMIGKFNSSTASHSPA
jgi:hypothetical protein